VKSPPLGKCFVKEPVRLVDEVLKTRFICIENKRHPYVLDLLPQPPEVFLDCFNRHLTPPAVGRNAQHCFECIGPEDHMPQRIRNDSQLVARIQPAKDRIIRYRLWIESLRDARVYCVMREGVNPCGPRNSQTIQVALARILR
jgi:hypothetical protein